MMTNQPSTILTRVRETLATMLATLDLGSILIFQILFPMSQSPTLGAWEHPASIRARVHFSSQATVLTATLEDQDSILGGLETLGSILAAIRTMDSILAPIRTMGSILAVQALVLLALEALEHLLSLLMTMRLRRMPSLHLLSLLTWQEETRDPTSGENKRSHLRRRRMRSEWFFSSLLPSIPSWRPLLATVLLQLKHYLVVSSLLECPKVPMCQEQTSSST